MSQLTFENLWKNHPSIIGESRPCQVNGNPIFDNQCAIRLGVSLQKSGVDTDQWDVMHCDHHKKSEDHKGHVLRAEELANVLRKHSIDGIGRLQQIETKDFDLMLTGKTGIIFFKDCWSRNAVEQAAGRRSGDHIDLWSGSNLAGERGLRLYVSLSKKIFFWSVK